MRKSPLLVLIATVLVDMIGFGIVLPLLPFYAESLGASPLDVTLLVASFSAMQLVAAPLWGRVSDRRGRRPLLVAGLFASSLSYLIFGFARTLPLLFVSRMAAGAAGGTISVAQAYVADTTRAEQRARGLGLIGAAAGLGVMIGPALGGFFSRWGLGAPGFVAAGLCAANGVAALLLLGESRPARSRDAAPAGEAATLRGWLRAMARYPLSLLLTVYFLAISSFAAMTSVLALYAERVFGIGAQGMGMIFTLSGGVAVLVRGVLLGWAVERFGEPRTVRAGALALSSSLLLTSWVPTAWWLGVPVVLYAVGAGTLFPALASLVSRATDEHSQGSILGGSQVVGGLGRVVGPIWAGILFQEIAITTPFRLGSALVAVAFLLAFAIPLPRPEAAPAPAAADASARGVTV